MEKLKPKTTKAFSDEGDFVPSEVVKMEFAMRFLLKVL
jgi:hypothetical protein